MAQGPVSGLRLALNPLPTKFCPRPGLPTKMAAHSQAADAHESRKSTIIAIVSSVLTVAFLLTSMRLYTRAVILRNFGIDDWACIFAFVSTACDRKAPVF